MAHLALGLLGPMQVLLDNAPITKLRSDKARALLAFLAIEAGVPHRRDTLVGLLWPDCPEQNARHNLRQALFELRTALDKTAASIPFLLVTRDEIQFNPASDFSLDVTAFNQHLVDCNAHLHKNIETCADCVSRLQEAAELYRGKFLQEFFLKDSAEFEEWALAQREALHQHVLDVLRHLTNHFIEERALQMARRYALRQLQLNPWHEHAHRQLMRVLALEGQFAAAQKQYETCRRMLAEELGVEPSAETTELYEQIRSGSWKSESESSKSSATSNLQFPSSNLPAQLTPFVGRERELVELRQLITQSSNRLITLVGPGGIGKTRLALQAAENQRGTLAQGVAFVPLASIHSMDAVVLAIADAVGLTFYGSNEPRFQLFSYLREKQMLLVLDNVEQILDAVGLFVEILQHAPQIKLLCTSREQLNLQGECVIEVEGLEIPGSAQSEGFENYDAVTLFLQRARRLRPKFRLAPDERVALVRLCRVVEGMPLALELAATWVRTLSITEIANEVERDLDFLSTSARDVPERHRSLRAVFDYSWRMLSVNKQQALAKLSVFRSGFQREAAEQVAGTALPLLSALLIRSLIRRNVAGRYDLHELIRQYAADRLALKSEEETVVRDRHSEYYLRYLQEREIALGSVRQKEALAELTPEMDNLHVAWRWAARRGNSVQLRQTAWSLWYHSELRNLIREGAEIFQDAVQKLQATDHLESDRQVALGLLQSYQTLLAARQGQFDQVQPSLQSALELLRTHGDSDAQADVLVISALAYWVEGKFADAAQCARQAHTLAAATGRRWQQVASTIFIGGMEHELGNPIEAERWLTQGLAASRALGDARLVSIAIGYLSRNAKVLGRITEMESLLRESLRLSTELNDRNGIALALEQLAQVAESRGDMNQARRLSEQSIAAYREICDDWCLTRVLNQTGYFALEWEDPIQAQGCFTEAIQIGLLANLRPLVLDALVGIAVLQSKKGSAAWAMELLAYVLQDAMTTQDTRTRAEQLHSELASRLSSQQIQSFQAHAKPGALDETINIVLNALSNEQAPPDKLVTRNDTSLPS
ncbi:MAG: BTAD domain-containing putative transcriptional regulator [Chloroflexota bacterium]